MLLSNGIPLLVVGIYAVTVFAAMPFDRRFIGIANKVFQNQNGSIEYRLPNNTRPLSYDLSIFTRIDLSIFDFSGVVKIKIAVSQLTQEIVLHARQLTIVNVTLTKIRSEFSEDVSLLPYSYNPVPEFLRIHTNGTDLNAGDELLLRIDYVGVLREDRGGFYRSSYENVDGSTTYVNHSGPSY